MVNEIRIEDGVMYVNDRPFDPVRGIFVDPAYEVILSEADEMLDQKIGGIRKRIVTIEEHVTRTAILLDRLATQVKTLSDIVAKQQNIIDELTRDKTDAPYTPNMKTVILFDHEITFDPTVVQFWGPNRDWLCRWQVVPQTFLYTNPVVKVEIESVYGLSTSNLDHFVGVLNEGTAHILIGAVIPIRMRYFDLPWEVELNA